MTQKNISSLDGSLKHFSTYDLGLAASLSCLGYRLIWMDKTDTRKVQFIFKKEIGILEDIDLYWADKLKVNARKYFENIKALKSRIYSE